MFLSSALRTFKRAKQYYLTTIVTLAITLAMVLSVFSLVNLVFFAPLPYQDSENLYQLEGKLVGNGFDSVATNPQLIDYINKHNSVFSDFAIYHKWTNYKLYDQKERPEISVVLASSNLFDLLGVKPELGRLFSDQEKRGNKQPSVILGYRAWKTIYRGDKNIVGKKIQLNQRRFTVIGVAPDNLVLPHYENINNALWIPLDMDETFKVKGSQSFMSAYKAVVRLKPNTQIANINKPLDELILKGAELLIPRVLQSYAVATKVTSFRDAIQSRSGNIVIMLMVGVVLLLVIALINLSSMQLARAVSKIKTVAISFAFGASNKQLLKESFQHNIIVIGFAVLLALLLTTLSFSLIATLADGAIQRLDTLTLSFNTLIFAVFLAATIALLYSLIELKVVKEKNLITSLQSSGKGVGKQMSAGASHLLIGLQVTFSFIILIAASHVVWKTLAEALRDNGLDSENKWTLTINYANIKKNKERKNVNRSIAKQLVQLSSIEHIEQASDQRIPSSLNTDVVNDEHNNYLANSRNTRISSGYLSSLGLTLIGKNFSLGDSELKNYPVIINQRLADIIGDDPQKVLGKKITTRDKTVHTIIGIVSNTYYAGAEWLETSEMYNPRKFSGQRSNTFLLTASDNNQLTQQVRELLTNIDSRLDIAQLITLKQQFNDKRQRHLTAAWLAIVLASVSLAMVIIGVNGIVNYMVQVRRYDLGVKLAMGADNSRLLKDSLGELMLPIGMSLLFAFSLCFLALGYSRSQPNFSVEANWLIVSSIVIGFAIVALLASYFPVRRILNGDPITALRNE